LRWNIDIVDVVSIAAIWGAFMSLGIGTMHVLLIRRGGEKEFTDSTLRVNQNRVVSSTISKNELFEMLKADQYFGRMKVFEQDDCVKVKTKMTFWSFGENIVIRTKALNENIFEYNISSKPWLPTTLVDYGKNLRNINRLENLIAPLG